MQEIWKRMTISLHVRHQIFGKQLCFRKWLNLSSGGVDVRGHVQGHWHDGRDHHVLLSPPLKTYLALFIMFAKTDHTLVLSSHLPAFGPGHPHTWTSWTRSPPASLSPTSSLVSFVLPSLQQLMAIFPVLDNHNGTVGTFYKGEEPEIEIFEVMRKKRRSFSIWSIWWRGSSDWG